MRSTAAKLDKQESSLFNSNRAIFVQLFIASESKDLYYLGLLGGSHKITDRLLDQHNSALQRDAARVDVSLRLVQVTVRRRNKIVEMFNDDEFAYEESRQKGAKDDDDRPRLMLKEDGGFGSAGPVTAPSSSRARMLAQQRELQLKKRESVTSTGGMIRSSVDGADALRRSSEHQFTPAVRQFSAPKAVIDSSADAIEGQSEFSKSARNQPIKMMRQQDEGKPAKPAKPARPPRASGRAAPDDGYKRSAYDDDDGADDVHYDHRGGPGGRRYKGNYDDDDEEEEEGYYDRRRGGGGHSKHRTPWEDDRDSRRSDRKSRPSRREREEFDEEDDWENEDRSSSAAVDMNPTMGSRSRADNVESTYKLDLSDMKQFLTTPLPKEAGTVQCQIRRNRDGTNKLHPTYTVYLKQDNVFLMTAKKRPNNRTSNYLISMGQNDLSREGPNYLGKLRSNFIGTEFEIYDEGHNPKDQPEFAGQQIRKEMGGVMYAANVLGHKGPRKMQVALPPVDEEGQIMHTSGDNDLIRRIKEHEYLDNSVYLINKPPRWNDQVGAYVLNFQGRVTMASVKNFQLVDPDAQDTVVLQFGRVAKEEFTMDMHYPITPFQAFAVTLSSFDSKIACD